MANTPKPTSAPSPSAPLPGPLEPGIVLQNRYAIERLIGGGGMGMVYLARDQRLSRRPCAIKEMVDHFIDPQQRIEANEYFAREADTLAQLKHSAIPAITDRFDDQNRHYLVMEYVEGRNLEEELAVRGGPFPEGLAVDIARQLCDVLAYLHGLTPPIVYRDMKPSNVMLTANGRVVLVDFGIARLFKAQRKGTMIGTLGFAPPEQYQGIADPRSDIYSLGATLHYVLTARDPEKFPPFSFPPVRDLRPEVSSNLAGAIDRALGYEMTNRPATVQEFRDMLLYGSGLGTTVRKVNSQGSTADLTLPPRVLEFDDAMPAPRRSKSVARRIAGMVIFTAALAGLAFGATYVYNDPGLQNQLGIRQYVDNLPWKHAEIVALARTHPLNFEDLSVELSTRAGDPLSKPKSSFTDSELSANRYLKWQASFKNGLAGLEGQNNRVEARIFDPHGVQIASSADQRFIGPSQTAADFSGVALLPDASNIGTGNYRIALYSNDQVLGQQQFSVTEDLAAKAAAARAKSEAEAAARSEEAKRQAEARKLAMLQERMRKPLQLERIDFINTTKDGTALSPPSTAFSLSKVLFVGWRVTFSNRLYGLDNNQYRVDAAYVAPDGSTLGSVDDIESVNQTQSRVTFSGRVGNAAGGAFLPGRYAVNFYLNGQYFAQRKFQVTADAGVPFSGGPVASGGGVPASTAVGLEMPLLASGTIQGISSGSAPLELRLRPQANGFLHGEMVVHLAGYGATPIEGFVRGNHVQFQVPYGAETYFFEGQRDHDMLGGTFESTPTGKHGSWATRAD
ncbi:MAG TPA: serine/threonine-protein kinase [Candidatus Binataceae bacterium]|nr:serine/threonine-protein kinase [Candidatus Binataceae bacterium]